MHRLEFERWHIKRLVNTYTIMRELIRKISLRARVAFIILCIENALEKESIKSRIQKTLIIFWHQTSIQFVDEWLYQVSKVMPDSILEDDYEDNEIITYQDFSELKESYKSIPKFVFELMELGFECGTIELYGTVENESEKTIQVVIRAIEIMKENNITLPNIELLQKFTITENGGWGREFIREEIFA